MSSCRWICVLEIATDVVADGFLDAQGASVLTSQRLTGALRKAFPYARSGGIELSILLEPSELELQIARDVGRT